MSPWPPLRNAAWFALILAVMWFSSLWLYDAHKSWQAVEWRNAVLTGETPFRWAFDTREDISSGHGIEAFRWEEGAVRGDLDDPYVYLNLRGRMIDTRRYSWLVIDLDAAESSFLRVFHHQGDDEVIHFSPPIPVEAGPQSIELDLDAVGWLARNEYRPDEPPRRSAWGSLRGLVTALRIDPVQNGGFEIRHIELRDRKADGPANDGVIPFSSLDDPRLEPLRHDPGALVFLAHDSDLRTPATAQAMRRAIAERYPSAILFPRPPHTEPWGGALGRLAQTGWLPSLLFAAALVLFAARPPASPTAVIAFVVMLGSFVFFEPYLEGAWKLPPLLLLAWGTWRLWPSTGPGVWQGAWPGDPAAWAWLSPLLAGSVILLLVFYERGAGEGPLWQNFLVYLGWALLQQVLVAVVIFGRLRARVPGFAVLLGAAAFGFMHLPNFALMLGTFVLGLCLLAVYRRHPNLPALAVTHALAATAVSAAAPNWLLLSREIGPRFLDTL